MALSEDDRKKIIDFLINTTIDSDPSFDQILLDLYYEIANKMESNYPEINCNQNAYYSTIIPLINDEILKTLEEARLFDSINQDYCILRQSIRNWTPSLKYLTEIPKLAPFQAALLDLLDELILIKYASDFDQSFHYLASLDQIDRDNRYQKIAEVMALITDQIAKEKLKYQTVSNEISQYEDHLIAIAVNYLTTEQSTVSEEELQRSLESAEKSLEAFLFDNNSYKPDSRFSYALSFALSYKTQSSYVDSFSAIGAKLPFLNYFISSNNLSKRNQLIAFSLH